MKSSNSPETDAPLPIMQAIQKLMTERKQLEQFAEESYAKLNQLREQIRGEATAEAGQQATTVDKGELEGLRVAVGQLIEKLDAIRADSSRSGGEEDVKQLRVERDLLRDEVAQLKMQVETKSQQGVEFEQLLEALVQEVGQREEGAFSQKQHFEEESARLREELKGMQEREQNLNEQLSKAREAANKAVQTEDSGDLAEVAAMIEQVESEIRDQQELIRRDRAALERERAEFEQRRQAAAPGRQPTPSSGVPRVAAASPSAQQRLLQFACKYCQGPMQAKEWLAGLVTKCPHCGKMAPVPKLGA